MGALLEALPEPPPGRVGWPWTEQSPAPLENRTWPRLSVVTPSFNQGRFLEHTIRSVLLQNYPSLEYIVIDGGSTDESRDIIEKYRPWLTYAVSEADTGQADALNKGFGRATGALHAYLNSDDFYLPGAFHAVALALADRVGTCLITGACDIVDEDGERLSTQHSSIATFGELADLWGVWYRGRYLPQPAVFWSRSAGQETRFRPDLHYVMDYELWGRLMRDRAKVVPLSLTLAAFRSYALQKSANPDAITREVLPILGDWVRGDEIPPLRRALIKADLDYVLLKESAPAVGPGRGATAARRAAVIAGVLARPRLWCSRQLLRDARRVLAARRRLRALVSRLRNRVFELTFGRMAANNAWGGTESVSGPGSSLRQTRIIRSQIPRLLSDLGCRVMLDAPCGDFHWLSRERLPVRYLGCDIVDELVARNTATFGSENVSFFRADISRDPLPRVDLILCRDCLVHLPNESVMRVLDNFASSGSRYLLTTTFPGRTRNEEIGAGEWRPINLQLPPFNLPEPVLLINEGCTEFAGAYRDKSLGLWDLTRV